MSEPKHFKALTFDANSVIFDEGDPADAAYLIRNGVIDIRIGSRGDTPQTLATLKDGDVFGEMALIEDRKHMASAVAVKKTDVVEIPRAEFNKRLDAMDPIMRGMIRVLVARLRLMANEIPRRRGVHWEGWGSKK